MIYWSQIESSLILYTSFWTKKHFRNSKTPRHSGGEHRDIEVLVDTLDLIGGLRDFNSSEVRSRDAIIWIIPDGANW